MTFRLEEDAAADRILRFLTVMDDQFVPPLHTRVQLPHYARKLAAHGINYFLVEDGADIAHAGFYCNDTASATAFISSIAVIPELQGSPAAAGLLRQVVAACRARQMRVLQLDVEPDNRKAVRFYQKHGFQFVSSERMQKALAERPVSSGRAT